MNVNLNKNKTIDIKNNIDNDKINTLITSKIFFFKNIIQNTFNHVQKNKTLDILSINDINICVDKITDISKKIKEIDENLIVDNNETIAKHLQIINNDFSTIFKLYGTFHLDDLLTICLGDIKKNITNNDDILKLNLLQKYFHPTGYKITGKMQNLIESNENNKKNKKILHENTFNNLLCVDIVTEYEQFYMKVYGIKLFIIHPNDNTNNNKLIIYGILDDVLVQL